MSNNLFSSEAVNPNPKDSIVEEEFRRSNSLKEAAKIIQSEEEKDEGQVYPHNTMDFLKNRGKRGNSFSQTIKKELEFSMIDNNVGKSDFSIPKSLIDEEKEPTFLETKILVITKNKLRVLRILLRVLIMIIIGKTLLYANYHIFEISKNHHVSINTGECHRSYSLHYPKLTWMENLRIFNEESYDEYQKVVDLNENQLKIFQKKKEKMNTKFQNKIDELNKIIEDLENEKNILKEQNDSMRESLAKVREAAESRGVGWIWTILRK